MVDFFFEDLICERCGMPVTEQMNTNGTIALRHKTLHKDDPDIPADWVTNGNYKYAQHTPTVASDAAL